MRRVELLGVGRPHIATIGALALLVFGWIFTGRYPWLLAGICFLDWWIVNLFNRVADLQEDRANRIASTGFVVRHARAIMRANTALLAGSLIVSHLLVPAITTWRLFFHAMGLAYSWPVLPAFRRTARRRIKDLYFWKNTASAAGFLVTVFAYPLAAADWSEAVFPAGIAWATVACAAVFFFLFETSYEVIYDLRDVEGDRLRGVRTYAVVHGVAGAARIVDGLLLASVAVLVAGYVAGAVPWRLAVMAAAPAINLVWYRRALRRGITAADCIVLTWIGAGLLAVYLLWVAAGLPLDLLSVNA